MNWLFNILKKRIKNCQTLLDHLVVLQIFRIQCNAACFEGRRKNQTIPV